jgi:peptide/nickel transport system substrate-binding protein
MCGPKRLTLIAIALVALLIAACAGGGQSPAEVPAAPAEAETSTEPATTTTTSGDLWYDPADLDATWYHICTDDAPSAGGTITSNQAAPALAGGGNWFSYSVKDQYMWNQLMDMDVNGETIHPDLATSWDVSEDGLVYTFNLRDDVRFHDGVQLTAHDVKWTMEAFLHPDSGIPFAGLLNLDAIAGADAFAAGEADSVEGINVVDDFTLEITLAQPHSSFLAMVRGLNIHPAHILESIPYDELLASEYATTAPIGSGPYKLGEYVPEQYYILEANEDYYAGRPYLDRIIMRIGLTGSTAIAALEADEIQHAGTVTPDDFMRLRDNPNFAFVGGALGGGLTVYPNLTRPPFDDLRVREAFMYALDREAIVQAYYDGGQLAQVLHSSLTGPASSPNIKTFEYNPELARQLLDEAGWDSDYVVQFLSYYQSDFDRRVQSAMQQYWGDAGIQVDIVYMDGPTFVQRVYHDVDFDLSYGCCGWTEPAALAEAACTQVFPAGYNVSHYCNEEFDSLVQQATVEPDPDRRIELFNQAEEIFISELGYMPMFWPLRYHAISSNVCGFNNRQISEPWTEMYPNRWYLGSQ